MINYSNEQLSAIYEGAKKLKESQPHNLTADIYLQAVLMEKINSLSQADAAEVITKMETTIREYNLNYNRAIKEGSVAAEDLLRHAISSRKMSEEDAINYLASMIVMVRNIGVDIDSITEEGVKSEVEGVIAGREVNGETVEALLGEAASAINATDMVTIDENIANLIVRTPLDSSTIETIREVASNPLYMSVWAYIEAVNDDTSANDKLEITPEGIALGVAMGIKIQEINADLSEGKVSQSTWLKNLKIALRVALTLVVILTLVLAILFITFEVNCLLGLVLLNVLLFAVIYKYGIEIDRDTFLMSMILSNLYTRNQQYRIMMNELNDDALHSNPITTMSVMGVKCLYHIQRIIDKAKATIRLKTPDNIETSLVKSATNMENPENVEEKISESARKTVSLSSK